MVAPREAYGETLVELGRENPDIVVLDSDLSGSTMTNKFAKVFPERFFNMGIAEANMMAVAAGLAQSGKVPFASTFAVFATGRAYDQVRQSIAYPRFNVKIVATHGGLTVGPDGGSHQSLEDVGIMRLLPGMTVIVPVDVAETRAAVRAAADWDGPVYIRLGREAVPDVLPAGEGFEIGTSKVLLPAASRDDIVHGSSRKRFDVGFIACGVMVKACLDAAAELEAEGVKCAVANFSSVKPLDAKLLAAIARQSKLIVTAEEHSVIGGLGGAVCESLSDLNPIRIRRVGVADKFGESGPAQALLQAYGLTAKDVARTAREALGD